MTTDSYPRTVVVDAHLYFVCDGGPGREELASLLDAALEGGADLLQLRDKDADRDRILALAPLFRAAADRHGVPFLLNDDPELALESGADGVHVGQDDISVAAARAIVGADAIVGLSTHSREQFEAAQSAKGEGRADYLSVGPVWETPTKQGRPATGLDYVRLAAEAGEDERGGAPIPWFAIGGIDLGNVDVVAAHGARRIVVVRAIRNAADPRRTAHRLREAVATGPAAGATASRGEKPDLDDPLDLPERARRKEASRSELKNQAAREALIPLDKGERPLAVTIGAIVSLAIAASILIAWLAGTEVEIGTSGNEERPNAFQVFPPMILFAVMAFGMWRARYWAVLGFQAVTAIVMIGAFLALISATSTFQAISTGLTLAGAGILFWFMVKALARIQMPTPRGVDPD